MINLILTTYPSSPKLISSTFEGSSSSEDFGINAVNGLVTVFDKDKPVVSAQVYYKFGESAEKISSTVKWSGEKRTAANLRFNIIEDSKDMAGGDIVLEFNNDIFTKILNYPSQQTRWESSEIVKSLDLINRDGLDYIPYLIISRYGIGVVEVPTEEGVSRLYRLGLKPYNLSSSTGGFNPMYIIDETLKWFGYIENEFTNETYFCMYSTEYRVGFKVTVKGGIKKGYKLDTKRGIMILKEEDNTNVSSIGIEEVKLF